MGGNQTRALRVSTPVNGYTIAEPSLWAPTVIELGPKGLKKLQFSKKNCSFAEMSRKKKVKFQIYCTMFYFQKNSFKIVQKKKKIYIIFKKIKIVVLRKCPGKK